MSSVSFLKSFRKSAEERVDLRHLQPILEQKILKREAFIDLMNPAEVLDIRQRQFWDWKEDRRPELLDKIFGIEIAGGLHKKDVAEEILFVEQLKDELDVKITAHKLSAKPKSMTGLRNKMAHAIGGAAIQHDIINEHMLLSDAWIKITAMMRGFESGRGYNNHYDFPAFIAVKTSRNALDRFDRLMDLVNGICTQARGEVVRTEKRYHLQASLRQFGGEESKLQTEHGWPENWRACCYLEFDIAGQIFTLTDQKIVEKAPRIFEIISDQSMKSEAAILKAIDEILGGDEWRYNRIDQSVKKIIDERSAALKEAHRAGKVVGIGNRGANQATINS